MAEFTAEIASGFDQLGIGALRAANFFESFRALARPHLRGQSEKQRRQKTYGS